jgi:hypothetical protein
LSELARNAREMREVMSQTCELGHARVRFRTSVCRRADTDSGGGRSGQGRYSRTEIWSRPGCVAVSRLRREAPPGAVGTGTSTEAWRVGIIRAALRYPLMAPRSRRAQVGGRNDPCTASRTTPSPSNKVANTRRSAICLNIMHSGQCAARIRFYPYLLDTGAEGVSWVTAFQ